MRLKLSVGLEGGREADLAVEADATTKVADVARLIALADPKGGRRLPPVELTMRVDHPERREIPGSDTLLQSGIQSGQHVTVVAQSALQAAAPGRAVAVVVVESGNEAGQQFPLRVGSNQVGRGLGNDVKLTDPLVSKAHLRVNVGEQVELTDLGSANGVQVRGGSVTRAVLGPDDRVTIGDTTFRIVVQVDPSATASPTSTVEFNRSPRLDPVFVGEQLVAPTPPPPPSQGRFPLIPLLAPIAMASVMFAITRNAQSILFVALSPLMMVGSFFEQRASGRRAFAHATAQFRSALKDLEVQLHYALDQEREHRRREHPSTAESLAAIRTRDGMLWTRRPDRRGFLEVRLGLGEQPSRNSVVLPTSNNTTPELWRELISVPRQYATVSDVPVVADLSECGALGIAGPETVAAVAVRSVVMQLVGLHSPAELVVCGVISPERAADWDWLKWLPHTSSDHSPLAAPQLAVASPALLIGALDDLVMARRAASGGSEDARAAARRPDVVVIVDDSAGFDRSELVDVLERGASVGVHFVWFATRLGRLPSGCQMFVEYDGPTATWSVGDIRLGERVAVAIESTGKDEAEGAARWLSPVVDAGAPVDDEADVPRQVSFLGLLGLDLAAKPEAIIDLWHQSQSLIGLPIAAGQKRRKTKGNTLTAVIGAGALDEPLALDLRTHGPHALVGGTTGAGKSEFLQTWVLAMAAAHSPQRVNFLFVDYKGGAAFSECTELPHSVGLVTDLSPHLVQRALVSLKAELKFREELFHHRRAKDLVEFERKDPAGAPPSLVIVVDEFAALKKEVPEFFEGVVDVAQRGRSLGLHLILATQRPAGVITDSLRANTNLRVALRMNDEADSSDVVGTKQAAMFDPGVPGRGVAKVGPRKLTVFQTAYVGGWTSDQPAPPVVTIDELGLGGGERWEAPDEEIDEVEADPGPNDLKRIVETIRNAASHAGVPEPRKPWQKELADVYDLRLIRPSRHDRELVFGVLDDPARQLQGSASFMPDDQGNLAVYGTGGSGKSTLLRSLVVAAGLSQEAPCHVYALDFGAKGLSMLEVLPHVGAVVSGDEPDRIVRLFRMLRSTIDERAVRFAAARAQGSVAEYRAAPAGRRDEPRLLVVVDGFSAFRNAYDGNSQRQPIYDSLRGLVSDGPRFGVHFVFSADRPGVIPDSIGSSIQRRIVLRLAKADDYPTLGIPKTSIADDAPAGRGFLGRQEIQVAVLGGSADTGRQVAALERLAAELRKAARWGEAPPIRQLPERIGRDQLPAHVGDEPVLGVDEESLSPVGIPIDTPFLLAGSPRAERTRYLTSIVENVRATRPALRLLLLSSKRTTLADQGEWLLAVNGVEQVTLQATKALEAMKGGATLDGVVIESVHDFVNSPADKPLQDLVAAIHGRGGVVIAEGDSQALASTSGIANALKLFKHGVALQPADHNEGQAIFRTTFAPLSRADFPEGRGMYVRHGQVLKVQCAVPAALAEV